MTDPHTDHSLNTHNITLGLPTWAHGLWVTPSHTPPPWPAIALFPPMAATPQHLTGLIEAITAQGFAVLSIDFNGFGRSPGSPRFQISLQRHLAEVCAAGQWLTQHPDVRPGEFAYWGISLSGAHVLNSLDLSPIKPAALILQTPFICGQHSLAQSHDPAWLKRLERLSQRHPHQTIRCIDSDQPGLLTGPRAQAFYQRADTPLITLKSLYLLTHYTLLDTLPSLKTRPPIYWLAALNDQLVTPQLSEQAFQLYPGPKHWHLAPIDHYALLLNECPDVLMNILQWLKHRLTAKNV
jgi:alpha-beta hydrolase superfamily lysophospholipase